MKSVLTIPTHSPKLCSGRSRTNKEHGGIQHPRKPRDSRGLWRLADVDGNGTWRWKQSAANRSLEQIPCKGPFAGKIVKFAGNCRASVPEKRRNCAASPANSLVSRAGNFFGLYREGPDACSESAAKGALTSKSGEKRRQVATALPTHASMLTTNVMYSLCNYYRHSLSIT